MAALVFAVLFLAMFSLADATWCVCRSDVSNAAQQKTLDYACGAGADCNPILQNGACFNPNTVLAHCSYAANSYFQKKGQAQGSCDFTGSALTTQTDPSSNGCTYPATPSAAATGSSSTQNPGSSSSSSTGSLTPTSTGTGVLGGLGPSGTTTSIDGSAASFIPNPVIMSSLLLIFFLHCLVWQRL
ncbi:hypothetical protein KFK09_005911 [Dendrobium nobile]|uniref:X8 domain-containing protein n=1 Tax=Dendrobium nobile TaxID=94219 RepID=A0A8T3C2Q0_DENNO|nr:hypothetical protein KFK09_005911 [Dendrobium nobile]